ncbi:MAG: hypothetical protein EOL95_09085 [Bacteroidia bacterium]|nr:hypothetical protein [Bacteroidia bacterium]
MNTDQLISKIRILENVTRTTIITHGDDYSTFRSRETDFNYSLQSTDPVLIKPILKVKKTHLVQSIINTSLYQGEGIKAVILDRLSTGRTLDRPEYANLSVHLAQIYTDQTEDVGKWLIESGCYENLLEKHNGIKEIFIDNIYNGATNYPNESVRDFVKTGLYKNKDTNELVLVSNYVLQKKFQNKTGLLTVGTRPNDNNFLILLGLMPAFVPAFKERLTPQEVSFFKLCTTPVKLYHERASALLYTEIIQGAEYDNLIREQRAEKLRLQFRKQEERMYTNAIQELNRQVMDLTSRLNEIERRLVAQEKEYTYYQAGNSKLEDAVSYIFDHAYLLDINTDIDNLLGLRFRVPLSQWDPEMAETILRGIKESPSRYNLEGSMIKDVQRFLQYILIEQAAKYWILAEFSIDLNTFQYRVEKLYWTGSNSDGFRPEKGTVYKAGVNPHMEYHSCVGSYRVQIDKAVQRKDLPGLIESLLAPYKNWNLSDGTVQGKMFRYALPGLINNNIPCIEYNGEMLDIHTFFDKIEADRTTPVVAEEPIKKKRTRKARVLNENETDHLIDALTQTVNVDTTRVFDEDALEEALRTQATAQGGEDNDN